MNLFLINTSTQLMNAIILSETVYKDEQCDVYYTDNLGDLIISVEQKSVFNKCFPIELPRDILRRNTLLARAIVRIKNALDLKKIEISLPSNPVKYERVLLSGQSLRNIEFYYAIKKQNKKVRLSLFEEGAFEYCMLGINSKSKIIFSKLFFGRYYLEDCEELFVYKPSLVKNNWDNINIRAIPGFVDNHDLKAILNDIFKYRHTTLDGCTRKVVFLEQAFFDQERDKRQIELINDVIDKYGQENVLVKMHPRSPQTKYNLPANSLIGGTPIELMVLNEDITSNIFISITSSATTNFKVIFNVEPIIIMLYRLFPSHNRVSTENEEFIVRVKDSCSEGTFFIPETIEEFNSILMNLLNDQHNKGSIKCRNK